MAKAKIRRAAILATAVASWVAPPIIGWSSPAAKAAPVPYTITDIGSLEHGGTSRALGINEAGEVVGSAFIGTAGHAVGFKNGSLTDLGVRNPDEGSAAFSINDNGVAVGTSGASAVRFADGTIADLTPPASTALAASVNAAGVIVGSAGAAATRAVRFDGDGATTDLGGLPGARDAFANDVNDGGVVVGYVIDAAGASRAVTFSAGTAHQVPGLAGEAGSVANDSSDLNGYVVGVSYDAMSHARATQFAPGAPSDLGRLPGDTGSQARRVNSSGSAVGVSERGFRMTAVLFSAGTVTDLNTLLPANSGWTLYDAFDINDLGQIVGAGTHNGITRGFVLTPLTRTRIQAFPSIAHVGGAGARLFLKFDAVLKTDSGRPVVGKAIDFVVGGSVACSGVTDEVGEATCGGLQAGVPQSVLTRGYVARFGGGPGYQASSAHGPILTVLDTSIS